MGPKSSPKFICKDCDYHTSRKSQYDRHLLTTKHIQMTSNDNIVQQYSYGYICECGKKYKHRQSLYNHRKRIHSPEKVSLPPKSTISPHFSTVNLQYDEYVLKKVTCRYCNKVFSRVDSLTRHLKINKKSKYILK